MTKTLFLVLSIFLLGCVEKTDLVIKNVKLFDGQKTLDKVNLHVKGNKICRISSSNSRINAFEVIDGTGKTIIPGLVNSHVHLNKVDQLKEVAQSGVLTVLDLFNTAESAAELRKFRDSLNYCYYYSSGPVATVEGGHGTQFGIPTPTISNVEEAEGFIENRINEGSDYLKIIVERGSRTWSVPTLSEKTIQQLLAITQRKEIKSVIHISTKEDALKAFDFGADGLAHIWSKNSEPITVTELKKLAQKSFFVIPTLLVLYKANKTHPQLVTMEFNLIKQEIKKLNDAGILILAGTDCPNLGINCSSDLINEMLLLEECGLTPLEVLKSATVNPAIAFKLKNGGVLKEGSTADFVLVNGDPTKNIVDMKKIENVWKLGKKVLHTTNDKLNEQTEP